MSEEHLDLLASVPGSFIGRCVGERPSDVAGIFIKVTRDLAGRCVGAAPGLERTAVEITGALRYQVKAAAEVVALTWEGNNLSLQGAHNRQVYGPDGKQIELPITNVARQDHTVFLQFAGAIVRGDMVTVAGQLVSLGWHVEGADRGGERLAGTYGFNEIRYTDDKDLEAATLLAQEVASAASQVGLSAEIKLAQVNGINPGTLEIWLSRL